MKKSIPDQNGKPFFIYKEPQPEGGQGVAEQLGEEIQTQSPRPRALFATAKPDRTPGGSIILNRGDPYSIAKEFVQRQYCKYAHLGLYYKGGRSGSSMGASTRN